MPVMTNYIAIIHKEPDSDFGVSFPDFPGCITAGRTLEEARDMAAAALQGHIAQMRDACEPLPTPSAFETVMHQLDFTGGLAFLVSATDRTSPKLDRFQQLFHDRIVAASARIGERVAGSAEARAFYHDWGTPNAEAAP